MGDFALRAWKRAPSGFQLLFEIAEDGSIVVPDGRPGPPNNTAISVDRLEIGIQVPPVAPLKLPRLGVVCLDLRTGPSVSPGVLVFHAATPLRAARVLIQVELVQSIVDERLPLLRLERYFHPPVERHWEVTISHLPPKTRPLVELRQSPMVLVSGIARAARWMSDAVSPLLDTSRIELGLDELDIGSPPAGTEPQREFRWVPRLRAVFAAVPPVTTRIGGVAITSDAGRAVVEHRLWWPRKTDEKGVVSYDAERAPWGRALCSIQGTVRELDVLSAWNTSVEGPHVGAVKTVLDDQSVSFLPFFAPSASRAPWQVFFVTDSEVPGIGVEPQGVRPMTATPDAPFVKEEPADASQHQVVIKFRGAATIDGTPLTVSATVLRDVPRDPSNPRDVLWQRLHAGLAEGGEGAHVFDIPFRVDGLGGQVVRLGALELVFAKTWDAAAQVTGPGSRLRAGMGAKGRPRIEKAEILLPVQALVPAGQDLPEDEEGVAQFEEEAGADVDSPIAREPPLVLALPDAPAAAPHPMTLTAVEQTSDGKRQTLQVRIDVPTVAGGGNAALGGRVLVIDGTPLSVVGVRWSADTATAEGSIGIAAWDNVSAAGTRWRFQQLASSPAWIWLPSQALGESMERSSAQGEGIGHGGRAQVRIAPAARLGVRSENLARRYVEAPWNLRRLLERQGDGLPGVRVEALRLELLYGIQMWTRTGEPRLRVAESFARMGRIPGRLPFDPGERVKKSTLYNGHRKAWDRLMTAYARRLAVLELIDPDRADDPAVESGVQAVLRNKPGQGVDEMRLPYDPARPGQEAKLAGGATWGLESRAVYESVTSDAGRRSTAARMEGLRFSALGGWGDQAAAFAGGRTVIRSSTQFGRSERIAYERIGRIAVFWNRAKHVIVYERTTVPSQQFFRSQTPHLGRPILRKVQEYVEILQESRSYPDSVHGGDAARGGGRLPAGFVESCTFITKRIPVDGRWGSDVADEDGRLVGWQVPLWRDPAAHPEVDPDVYPRPFVTLDVSCDGPQPANTAGRVRAPDQLYFFADTVEGRTDDTDAWPPVQRVDFDDVVQPQPESGACGETHDLDGPQPDAAAHPPGLSRFTYELEPTRRAVNVVAGLTDQPMGARIANVTMMRADASHEKPPASVVDAGLVEDALHGFLDRVRDAIPSTGTVGKPEADRVKAIVKDLENAFADTGEIGRKITSFKVPSREALCGRLKGEAERRGKDLRAGIDRLLDDAEAAVVQELKIPEPGHDPVKELRDAVARLRGILHARIGSLRQAVDGSGDLLSGGIDRALEAVRSLRASVLAEVAALRSIFAATRVEDRRTALLAQLDAAQRRLVEAVQRCADALHAALRNGFSKVASAVDTGFLGQLDAAVRRAVDRMRAVFGDEHATDGALRRAIADLELFVDGKLEAADAVASRLLAPPRVGDGIRKLASSFDEFAAGAREEIQRLLAGTEMDVTAFKAAAKTALDKLADTEVETLLVRVDTALDARGNAGRAIKASAQYTTARQALKDAVRALVADANTKLDAVQVPGDIGAARRAIGELLTKALAALREKRDALLRIVSTIEVEVARQEAMVLGSVRKTEAAIQAHLAAIDAVLRQTAMDAAVVKANITDWKDRQIVAIQGLLTAAKDALTAARAEVGTALDESLDRAVQSVTDWISGWRDGIDALLTAGTTTVGDVQGRWDIATAQITAAAKSVFDEFEKFLRTWSAELRRGFDAAAKQLGPLEQLCVGAIDRVLDDLDGKIQTGATIEAVVAEAKAAFVRARNVLRTDVDRTLDRWTQSASGAVESWCNQFLPDPEQIVKDLKGQLAKDVREALDGVLGQAKTDAAELRAAAEAELRRLRRRYGPQVQQVRAEVENAVRQARAGGAEARRLFQEGSETLRLVRAFGDTPIVPDLHFNRERIGYYFAHPDRIVETTPMVALANRVGDHMKAMGLRVPTKKLLDQVIPDSLQHFDLSHILPDFGGLKLDGLFGGVRFPQVPDDRVRITHGLDKESLRAWLEANVDTEVLEPATVFSMGGLTLTAEHLHLTARIRFEADPSGVQRRQQHGNLSADWLLRIGGRPIITFKDTSLHFDDSGHIRFDLDPSKVKLESPLDLISDLVKKLVNPGSGVTLRRLEGPGIIAGAEAVLDLPLPPVQGGAFGLKGLHLGATFGIVVTRGSPSGIDFALTTGANLGSKAAPFSMVILFLSGGGWIDVHAKYWPQRREIAATLSIGIHVGAEAGLSLGPISGSVYLRVGLEVDYTAVGRGGAGLTVTMFIAVGGEATALGFIQVEIKLRLEASYSDSRVVGRGSLSLCIRICWCFTFRFETAVEYAFVGGPAKTQPAAPPPGVAPGAALAAAAPVPAPATPPQYARAATKYLALLA